MKTIHLIAVFFILTSCGPHRMRCGARGICQTQPELIQPEIQAKITIKA
ncbi:hypothetical protein [Flavobacterium acetivorans]|nr:hypothetical protein [Flavobacterium sp. F-29]UFH36689.1 hypothetical protein LNP19_06500 [Flavobacterium sp. F-29]